MTTLNPYLGFRDNAREAMTFYHSVFGGSLTISTFADFGADLEPSEKELVMHSHLVSENGLTLMGSDTPHRMDYTPGDTFSVSLSGDDDAELTGYYNALVAGGTVLEPLMKAPWGDSFGMLIDQFGVRWLVNIASPANRDTNAVS